MSTINVYRVDYPEMPTHAVPTKLGSCVYKRGGFERKESAFRRAAELLGIAHSGGQFCNRVETWNGMTVDLSSLIIPVADSSSYIKVGFHS